MLKKKKIMDSTYFEYVNREDEDAKTAYAYAIVWFFLQIIKHWNNCHFGSIESTKKSFIINAFEHDYGV